MSIIKPPLKPFSDYKWRWAALTPTESLNSPPVFLGALRVFCKFQNYPPSSKEIMEGLAIVQEETKSNVDLVRNPARNLVRNSGQYWKALGLLQEEHGKVLVSPFGQLLATGKITQVEFATTIVKTLELPNKRIVGDTSEWDKAGLKIKPLQLILDILGAISEIYHSNAAFISPFELVKIIIPLAGAKAPLENYADAIIQNREGKIDLSEWPDCAPDANDKRMAREFLLFLSNYGFCNVLKVGKQNIDENYSLSNISIEEVVALRKLIMFPQELDKIAKTICETQIPASVERKRVTREVLERPNQTIFRKNILTVFNSTCIVTGVRIENVLEAAHIIDVKYNGSDKVENGLCLRSDIHQLFDSKHLRLFSNGRIVLSEVAAAKANYSQLPSNIVIPDFINKDHLDWRVNYT